MADLATTSTANPDALTPKPAPRTDLDFAHFRALLDTEAKRAEETIEATNRQEADGINDSGTDRAELSIADENHPADAATDLFMREEDMALVENARALLAQIHRALAKLDDGTYGLSDRSGEPIPVERLEAVPYSTLTVAEQEIEETH